MLRWGNDEKLRVKVSLIPVGKKTFSITYFVGGKKTLSFTSGLPDGLFSNQKSHIWVNFGGPLNGKCWYIL
jgi:hypothetical protein